MTWSFFNTISFKNIMLTNLAILLMFGTSPYVHASHKAQGSYAFSSDPVKQSTKNNNALSPSEIKTGKVDYSFIAALFNTGLTVNEIDTLVGLIGN